jgi:DUF4097 and DUF4098 domain-containing protein YvlB
VSHAPERHILTTPPALQTFEARAVRCRASFVSARPISMKSLRNRHPHDELVPRARAARLGRALSSLLVVVLLLCLMVPEAAAQKRFSKEYPARANVQLHLYNLSGTIEVEAWDRLAIKIQATMEAPAAKMTPEVSPSGIQIDMRRDNRQDVGDVNFTIRVPAESSVNISTMRGNITIRNVRGQMVRASVSTEGDIELTGIRSLTVKAENRVGNILFDAELRRGGTYELDSTLGDIQLRISAEAGFRLMAVAPRTRSINLNGFEARGQFEFSNEKRRVVGKVGEGGATLSTTNGRGSISFMPR